MRVLRDISAAAPSALGNSAVSFIGNFQEAIKLKVFPRGMQVTNVSKENAVLDARGRDLGYKRV